MKWNEKSKQYQIRRSTERTTRNARQNSQNLFESDNRARSSPPMYFDPSETLLNERVLLFLTFTTSTRTHWEWQWCRAIHTMTARLNQATNTKSLHSRLQCSLWADSDQKKNIDVRMRKTGKTTSTVLSLSIQSQEPQCAEAITNETCSQTTLVHLQNSNKKAPNKTYPWFLLNLNPTEIEQYPNPIRQQRTVRRQRQWGRWRRQKYRTQWHRCHKLRGSGANNRTTLRWTTTAH